MLLSHFLNKSLEYPRRQDILEGFLAHLWSIEMCNELNKKGSVVMQLEDLEQERICQELGVVQTRGSD
jgi:hypothetical protein